MRPGAAPTRLTLHLFLAAALLLSFTAPAAAQSPAQRRASAKAQFERAQKQRTALEGKPQQQRTADEYLQVISSYRRTYLITPHAPEVQPAYIAIGELYREMGRGFDPKYYQSAISAYQFLLHEYPTTRYREEALITVGQIQKEDQHDFDAAQRTFEEFLQRHPRSPKTEQAREALEQLGKAEEKEAKPSSRKKLEKELAKEERLPQVTQIRTWNADNYTRVVIDIEDQVKYQAARISDPDRIYFDLNKAKLSSTLAGKTFQVQSGFLKTIRVAQNQSGVVRVVLEVDKVKDYSVFLLPNPYRLVVDIYGIQVAKSAAPSATEKPAEVRHTEKPAPPPVKSEPAKAQPSKTAPARTETAKAEPLDTGPAPPPRNGSKSGKSSAREAARPLKPPPVPEPNHDGQRSLTRTLGLKIGRIVIDAGHGGHDTGTIGPSGLMEKDLCLDVALRLGKMIQQRLPGAEVVYTREDDTFIPLENRTAIANQAKADLFISIHANSSHDHAARGVETYYLNFAASPEAMEVAARENSLSQGGVHELQDMVKKIARNEKIEESRELAGDIQDALTKRLQRVSGALKNRGVRKAPFVVLIGANMPSVLSEIAFISNSTDEKLLKKPENRQRVAEGLYHGMETYLQSINSLTYNRSKSAALGNSIGNVAHPGNPQ